MDPSKRNFPGPDAKKKLRRLNDDLCDLEQSQAYQELIGDATEEENTAYGISLSQDVQYLDLIDDIEPEDIQLTRLARLRELLPGALIGQRVIQKDSHEIEDAQISGELIERLYPPEYRKKAGLCFHAGRGLISITAEIKGKLIFLKSRPYLVSTDRDAVCSVRISEDRMEASVDCSPNIGLGKHLPRSAIVEALKNAGVSAEPDDQAIDAVLHRVNTEKQELCDVTIARGTPVKHGSDGYVQYQFPPAALRSGPALLPDGRVDYKAPVEIPVVQQGDMLAEIFPPEPGTEGLTVCGERVPARSGTAAGVLSCGENVAADDEGTRFIALVEGQVSLNAGILSVYECFTVVRDINYSTGNIVYDGTVQVPGSLLAGFSIKAGGDVYIRGDAEGTITAGGSVYVEGNVRGGGDNHINAGKDIYLKNAQNARIEAEGDVTVLNSAIQSSISCLGVFRCNTGEGVIVGGAVDAYQGIDCSSAGSSRGVKTELIAGRNHVIAKRMKELSARSAFCKSNILKIETRLARFKQAGPDFIARLDPAERKNLKEILRKEKNLILIKKKTDVQLESLRSSLHAEVPGDIRVRNILYPDVTIKLVSGVRRITEKHINARFVWTPETEEINLSS